MSGGGSSAILPAVGAGLGIASLIATGGADAPLVAAEEGSVLGGTAVADTGVASYDAGLSADAMANFGGAGAGSGLPTLSQAAVGVNALNGVNAAANGFSPQELQAIQQGQADSFVQNPNQYYPTASTDANAPLVPVNPAQNVPTSASADTSAAQNVQNAANQAPVTTPTVPVTFPNNVATTQDLEDMAAGPSAGPVPTGSGPGGNTYQAPWYQQYWNNLTDTSGKGLNFAQKATLGGAGIATLLALQNSGAMKPNYLPQYNPVSAKSVGLGANLAPGYQPNRASQWGYAMGGNVSTYGLGGTASASASNPNGPLSNDGSLFGGIVPQAINNSRAETMNVMPADLQNKNTALPSSVQDLMAQYGVTPQQASQGLKSLISGQPSSASGFKSGGVPHLKEGSFVVPADVVSHFGNGSTDAGLQALHRHLGAQPIMGQGDGMSDDIATTIDGKQPARVANGEAVVHPDKVKELGKGSTDAGAKKLYAMMNKVRKARTGTTKQGKQIKADQYLPV